MRVIKLEDQALGGLRRFRKKKPAVEVCEMCSQELPLEHDHLIEPASRRLQCVCTACALLFDGRQSARFKRVPRRVRYLPDFDLTDAQWESLLIPINMAFFFKSSVGDRITALYPSPAGATESLLPLETWDDIVKRNPTLANLEPDVEALLVNRVGPTRASTAAEHYILPIDQCYRLVGLIRTHWKGLSGGTEVWREIGQFFAEMKRKAGVPEGEASRA